jgi:ATP-dependent DNA helicase RecQ
MRTITFFDTEIEPNGGKILDIGGIKGDGNSFHSGSLTGFVKFISGSGYLCGHNIFNHDLKYIQNAIDAANIKNLKFIDTLHLSPLLFPCRPYHALLKDDKLQTDEINNPLNDSKKTKDLFCDEVTAFHVLDDKLKRIFYFLLSKQREFSGFFNFLQFKETDVDIEKEIRQKFHGQICEHADLADIISKNPIELSYCLALINVNDKYSITPPWILRSYPSVERVMFLLRNNPCLRGCIYCNEALDIYKGLKQFFGFDSFRKYEGEPLQEKAVAAAVKNKSLLVVFPTGGGKSVTFQVPALMSGINSKGLTLVVSPLQSLMKDQVDNLEKVNITEAVTINGLLDPIERAKSIERVENGSASILYISPESLRSRTIERLLLGRNVVRFVIDEAHCLSAWGQDFRVDYLYIGDFIKSFREKKNIEDAIPVSCFTATAKQKVIEDTRNYFREKLSIDMELFTTSASRSNLRYNVSQKDNEEEKYNAMRNLIDGKKCPTIVYVSRTVKAYRLAQRLKEDGYEARPYHGKMKRQEKTENQDAFMRGEVRVMVATSAFGMGVDKRDVGMVIHYEISDSLENYVQEAGRAGRDESITADCHVLFNHEDLDKHFILLNQTKLNIREIQQVWKAIKDLTRFRSKISESALEIARKAGWDDNVAEIETRVRAAIAALEDAGYLKRGQNMPRIFANSILSKNAREAIDKIGKSDKFNERQKMTATRIIKKLFSSKSKYGPNDEGAESRVDYISDHLGIVKEEVIQVINILREERILADYKDLTAFIRKKESKKSSLDTLEIFSKIERFLATVLPPFEKKVFHLKELNEQAKEYGCKDVMPDKIKTILNFWVIKNWITRRTFLHSNNHIEVSNSLDTREMEAKLTKRLELAQFIIKYLYDKSSEGVVGDDSDDGEILVEFSVLGLKEGFESELTLFDTKVTSDDMEDALFYLSRIGALKIEGGFLVVYNPLSIERIERDNRKRYKLEDYEKLNQFYKNKIQQIHIVGEYARKMISDYKSALQFVDDYFRLNYASFLNKYFKGTRQNEIGKNITPTKFKQIFGDLSPAQLKIINDSESKYIVVAAGPGSGKTRILVHKLASLMLLEDVKHEQLLMVTFSRSAATEFKKRLLKLIGNAANFIEIKTFHSYCFDLLGKIGTIEKSDAIIREAVAKIKSGEVEINRITKTVLVIDEAQDMDADEFALIKALMECNEEMRIIAVGDDDQNIYEFRGASSEYLKKLLVDHKAVMYELVENYRSKSNLVDFTNQFVEGIPHRLKSNPIVAIQRDQGKIKLVRYNSSNLVKPVADDILSTDLSGTSCVLTKTNDEALKITGLLLKNGMPAKLIQSNEGFNIHNLLEVRFFLNQFDFTEKLYTINDEIWSNAKRKLIGRFRNSPNLDICLNIIRDFEMTNPKTKYRSDLDIFIRESRLEDFIDVGVETILVSTIHKAKGKEFDNVFLVLDNFNAWPGEAMRQLYVAMTRAKCNLTIHYNGSYLDPIEVEGLDVIDDFTKYSQPDQFTVQLTHRDVWLDYFFQRQGLITRLNSGDKLLVSGDFCINSKGQRVLAFSRQFTKKIETIRQKDYVAKSATIRFIIYWQKEDTEKEIKIILPELYFEKECREDGGSGIAVV